MPRVISSAEACSNGIEAIHQQMENGERRFRLVSSDGSSYIRTEASSLGGWQKSHYHKSISEIYIVQKGWIAFAELTIEGKFLLKFVEENSTIIVNPLVRHNLFMPPYTVTHVVKYGKGCTKDDWFPSISLDNITMHILESDLVQMREQSHVNSRSTTSGLMGMEL